MWTIIRFALAAPGAQDHRTAFELLRRAGFQPHHLPASDGQREAPGPGPLVAAAVADLLQDPAVVSRAVFVAFSEARLRPLFVTGAHVSVSPPRARASASLR